MPFESWDEAKTPRDGIAAPAHMGARTYRLGKGTTVFYWVFVVLSAGGTFAFLLFGPDLATQLSGLGLCGFFGLLAGAGLYQARHYRVTVDDDGIEVVVWRRPRRLEVSQIRGVRTLASKGGVTLLFESRDPKAKDLKVGVIPSMFSTFDEWMKRLPDLDKEEQAQSEAGLRSSPELGATPAERERKLAKARAVARLLNWTAFPVGIWVLVFPRPYAFVVTAAFIYPLLALLVAATGRGLYQFLGKRNDARPALGVALFGPGLFATIRAFDFDLIAPRDLLLPAIGCAVVLAAIALLGDRTLRERPGFLLLVVPLMTGMSAGALTVANCWPDRSCPSVHEARVLEKHQVKGKGASWNLVLGPWGPRTTTGSVEVPPSLYESVKEGDRVQVRLRPGRLGFEWFRVARGAPTNLPPASGSSPPP